VHRTLICYIFTIVDLFVHAYVC